MEPLLERIKHVLEHSADFRGRFRDFRQADAFVRPVAAAFRFRLHEPIDPLQPLFFVLEEQHQATEEHRPLADEILLPAEAPRFPGVPKLKARCLAARSGNAAFVQEPRQGVQVAFLMRVRDDRRHRGRRLLGNDVAVPIEEGQRIVRRGQQFGKHRPLLLGRPPGPVRRGLRPGKLHSDRDAAGLGNRIGVRPIQRHEDFLPGDRQRFHAAGVDAERLAGREPPFALDEILAEPLAFLRPLDHRHMLRHVQRKNVVGPRLAGKVVGPIGQNCPIVFAFLEPILDHSRKPFVIRRFDFEPFVEVPAKDGLFSLLVEGNFDQFGRHFYSLLLKVGEIVIVPLRISHQTEATMKRNLESIYNVTRTIVTLSDWDCGVNPTADLFSDVHHFQRILQFAIDAGFVTLRPCQSVDNQGRLQAVATWKGQCFVDLYEECEKLAKDHGKSSKKAMIARLHLLGFH